MVSRKILIPVDSSENTSKSVEFYLGNLKHDDDYVIVYNFVELPAMIPDMAINELAQKTVDVSNEAKALVKKYEQILKHNGLAVRVIFQGGSKVGEEICRLAEERNSTMIVMGARGCGGDIRTVLGSATDYVLHHTKIPVVVVPPPD